MQKTSMKTTGTALLLSALLAVSAALSACTAAPASSAPSPTAQPSSQEESAESGKVTFTDDLDREVTLESWDTVVSLYGSFAETWELAGGELAGVTEDAVEERHMDLGEGVETIGSVKSPNLEAILALDPDRQHQCLLLRPGSHRGDHGADVRVHHLLFLVAPLHHHLERGR